MDIQKGRLNVPDNGEYKVIYPETSTDQVIDSVSGKKIKEIVDDISLKINTIEVNILDFGAAVGEDSTVQIQNAIDFVASQGGGTVKINAGEFLIKAHVDNQSGNNILHDEGGIALKDNVTLLLDRGATLKAIPNDKKAYNIIRIYNKNNVKVIGGNIQGEFDKHIGLEGEWGYGIAISGGKNIELRDLNITNCWGDGWNLQIIDDGVKNIPENIILENVNSYANRRHGAAIEGGINVSIKRCIFSDTYLYAGLDVEPYVNSVNVHGYVVDNLTIENCVFENCQTNLLIYSDTIKNVKVINNEFKQARGQTNVNVAHDPSNIQFIDNLFVGGTSYAKEGVALIGGTNHKLVNNNFVDCYALVGTNTNDVELSNNIFTSESMQILYASILSGNNVKVKNNTFKSMFDSNNPTAINFGSLFVTAKNIIIESNLVSNVNQGIAVQNSAQNVVLRNNQIINSRAVAITVDSPNIVIEKNIIAGACWNNNGASAVNIGTNSLNCTIVDNTVLRETLGNQLGSQFAASAFNINSPSTITGMRFSGNTKQHVAGTNFKILNNIPTGNGNFVNLNDIAFGTTAQRPDKTQQDGTLYGDTTLNKLIWFNGNSWVDSNGSSV